MTIHGAKGLEFEVVIVPDLQASSGGKGERRLLSWLERGLPEPDATGDITEFLIAPLPRKGGEKGRAKSWVDQMIRQREMQEMRRLFYVAATRAREQLHLFARPVSKRTRDGDLRLDVRKDSLLSTAWPALGAEIDERFAAWQQQHEPADVADLAASASNNVIAMPSPSASSPLKPVFLRRLPADYNPAANQNFASPAASPILGLGADRLYARHEGGLTSRALGIAVHALFENLARLRLSLDWPACRAALSSSQPSIAAQIRAIGLDPAQSTALAARALQIALDATHDPICQWILLDHPEAASEVAWAGLVSGSLRTVRVDRIFQAGSSPNSQGRECWWIIDYKTAHADALDPAAALPELRTLFAPQLQAYAAVLRQLHGADVRICAGLYYPRMLQLDWWELTEQ
jgi:ATP-dependent exoDNAse (exonuclease V) beta subunit